MALTGFIECHCQVPGTLYFTKFIMPFRTLNPVATSSFSEDTHSKTTCPKYVSLFCQMLYAEGAGGKSAVISLECGESDSSALIDENPPGQFNFLLTTFGACRSVSLKETTLERAGFKAG